MGSPQASAGMSRSTPAMPPSSSRAAMTTTTGAKRSPGYRARNAAIAAARTSSV